MRRTTITCPWCASSRLRPAREGDEAGLTLIEMLITVTILGLAITAMLGGMTTLLSTTGLHRKQADVSSVVENAAEGAKADAYGACTSTSTPTYALPSSNLADVANPVVVSVTYWNVADTGFQTTCPSPQGDQGLQLVTISATSTDGTVTQSLSLIKANR